MRLRDEEFADRIAALITARRPEPEPESWLEQAVHRRLVVHTKGDPASFEGTLRVAAADGLVLWAAGTVVRDQTGKTAKVTLQGDVFIPREQIAFIQTTRS